VRKRIPVYRRVKDVYVKMGEVDEREFEWLKDEDGMEIVAVYIDELEEGYFDSEEERS